MTTEELLLHALETLLRARDAYQSASIHTGLKGAARRARLLRVRRNYREALDKAREAVIQARRQPGDEK